MIGTPHPYMVHFGRGPWFLDDDEVREFIDGLIVAGPSAKEIVARAKKTFKDRRLPSAQTVGYYQARMREIELGRPARYPG